MARAPGVSAAAATGARRLETLDFRLDDRPIGDPGRRVAARQARHERLEPLEAFLVQPEELGDRLA
jgi:hypothetical protein